MALNVHSICCQGGGVKNTKLANIFFSQFFLRLRLDSLHNPITTIEVNHKCTKRANENVEMQAAWKIDLFSIVSDTTNGKSLPEVITMVLLKGDSKKKFLYVIRLHVEKKILPLSFSFAPHSLIDFQSVFINCFHVKKKCIDYHIWWSAEGGLWWIYRDLFMACCWLMMIMMK